jgi:hypothetical protein
MNIYIVGVCKSEEMEKGNQMINAYFPVWVGVI